MAMINETIFAGRDNVFSLQLVRGGEPINLLSITGYQLVLSNGKTFTDLDMTSGMFLEKPNGVVEISIGDLLEDADKGRHTAYLVTYDPVNDDGIRWPNFKLKVA